MREQSKRTIPPTYGELVEVLERRAAALEEAARRAYRLAAEAARRRPELAQ